MGTTQQTITTAEPMLAEENAGRGLSSVSTLAVRVAGFVPTRVDMRFAGTREQQLGITLGAVLVHVSMQRTCPRGAVMRRWRRGRGCSRRWCVSRGPRW